MECPKCGNKVVAKQYGDWIELRCSRYPFCEQGPRYTKEAPEGVHVQGEYDGKYCSCGKKAVGIDDGGWDEESAYVCAEYPDCEVPF